MFSDSFDPGAKESALLPLQRQTLSEANRLLEDGKPAQAAPQFAKLAEVLTSAGQPRRAALLHGQAALAFARSRNGDASLTQARAAFTLFLHYKLVEQASVFYTNISRELTNRGLQTAADALAKEFASRLGTQPAAAAPLAARPALLPTTCPQCGAPVRSSELHWIDADTAECAFCGTSIRAQA